jgi:nitrate/nitrite transporter NarK
MTGNLGGFVGPVIVGDAAANEDFATGLARIAIFPFIAAALIFTIGWLGRRRGAEAPVSK